MRMGLNHRIGDHEGRLPLRQKCIDALVFARRCEDSSNKVGGVHTEERGKTLEQTIIEQRSLECIGSLTFTVLQRYGKTKVGERKG